MIAAIFPDGPIRLIGSIVTIANSLGNLVIFGITIVEEMQQVGEYGSVGHGN